MAERQQHVSRRGFLAGLGAAGTLALLRGPTARAAVAPAREVSTQVAVLGGGVGGLTVALELAERGLQVPVFEPKALGGKARSIPRSEERRVGQECVMSCSSRWSWFL